MQRLKPLVLTTFRTLAVQPFKYVKQQAGKITLKKILAQIYDPAQGDAVKALSAAVGVFIGIIPLWGLQTLLAIAFAIWFKLNKTLTIIFSQVSFPPMLPFVVLLSYRMGAYWIRTDGQKPVSFSLSKLNGHLLQYIYGSITLAVIASAAIGLIIYLSLKLVKLIKQSRLAVGQDI